MKTINVAFGLHNHQPVGNFDFVFEDAYKKCYLPFLELLERHPKIRLAQHYTGILLNWLDQHHPEFVPRLRALVEQDQVEMMTGGFYEPILSVLPDRDKVGQITKLTDHVKASTGYSARGMWMAERIWEPHLPKYCSQAGVEYVVLDDSHFKCAGLRDEELLGYYLTEENGSTVKLFPICEKLRYTIPFQDPQETINLFRKNASEAGTNLLVFADDGEKFGVWPGTYEHCYEDGWLESFFQALEDNLDWINLIHPGEALDTIPPAGRVYLPTASYREMMEWAMPTKAIHEYEHLEETLKQQQLHDRHKAFVRGGFWRNFMVKYPESNNMHKKMLHVSRRLQGLTETHGSDPRFLEAQDHLWAGQCNCPYWHGVFGGLYLNHLRYAIYHELIQAEAILDELQYDRKKTAWTDHAVFDFDADGADEILVANPVLGLGVSPGQGGAIFELDYKPAALNLLDTMTRREEAYHKKLKAASAQQPPEASSGVASIHDIVVMKEPDLDKQLVFDSYRRTSCLDHFLAEDTTLKGFARCDYQETADFLRGAYSHAVESTGAGLSVHLSREGNVATASGVVQVYLSKRITIDATHSRLQIDYKIKNFDNQPLQTWFGSEWDFALLAGDAPDRYYQVDGVTLDDARLRSSGELSGVDQVRLVDEWLKVRVAVAATQNPRWWRFPIETISQSEGGFERVYQSSVVMPHWRLAIEPGRSWNAKIEIEVSSLA